MRSCLSVNDEVGHHSVLGTLSLAARGPGSLCLEEHKAHPHTHQKETIHTGSVFAKCMEAARIIHGTAQVKPLSFRRTLFSQFIPRSTLQGQQMLLPVLLGTVTPIYYMLSRVTVAIQPRDECRDSLHLKRCIT